MVERMCLRRERGEEEVEGVGGWLVEEREGGIWWCLGGGWELFVGKRNGISRKGV